MNTIFKKSFNLLTKRQTNILSAAFVIMATIILSYVLGLVKLRMLAAVFGPTNTLGVYTASSKIPDAIFQVVILSSLATAFIPIFSEFLSKERNREAYTYASTLLVFSFLFFACISLILILFASPLLHLFNPGSGFSEEQLSLMANLMKIMIGAQLLFILGSFLSSVLQSYNQFFIPGVAAAMYNGGILIGLFAFSNSLGIYAPAVGGVIGAAIFMLLQVPFILKTGFQFIPTLSYKTAGIVKTFHLMWQRSLALLIVQFGTLVILSLTSYLSDTGRNYYLFDIAQSLTFVPIALCGAIAQAAFPVLSRQRDKIEEFKTTFSTSFTQVFYLAIPVSVLFIVLRIPVVRLVFGASKFDWDATVLTGRTLAFFALSIFAQTLLLLILRAFYALQDTKTPLVVSTIAMLFLIVFGELFIRLFHFGVWSLALAYSLSGIIQFGVLLYYLDEKTHGLPKKHLLFSMGKILLAAFFTGFALYIPIKLLDKLVFDTTHTINLIILTGISSICGLSLYLFLTWLLDVREASMFLHIFKKASNWRGILQESSETLEQPKI